MKIHSVVLDLLHADRQTIAKLIVTFLQLLVVNASKNLKRYKTNNEGKTYIN
jgi:hypothetical protein